MITWLLYNNERANVIFWNVHLVFRQENVYRSNRHPPHLHQNKNGTMIFIGQTSFFFFCARNAFEKPTYKP